MILTIASRELRRLFLSPVAWTVLAVVQFVLAFTFFIRIDEYLKLKPQLAVLKNAPGVTDMIIAPLFGFIPIILLFVTPLMTMRLISEERQNNTFVLLTSAPISMTEIILGKYIGLFVFLFLITILATFMSLSLLAGGTIDLGLLFSCWVGLTLLLAGFVSIGLYISTLTSSPTIAAMGTFGAILFLWLIDMGVTPGAEGTSVAAYLSIIQHYQPMMKGLINTSDVIYYVLLITSCLVMSVRRLDSYRTQH